jgi:phospholipid-binding lipoprotein MlaA
MGRLTAVIAITLSALSLAACATKDPEAIANNDPFEPTNRFFFDVSQKADKWFAKPVAQGYVAVVPEFARDGIHNMLDNINEPVVFGNEVLQGSAHGAATTLGRFVVNSTVGVGGAIDVGSKIGLNADDQDGGITLGKWGVKEGPYIFLPLLGPAPPRDILGRVGDRYLQPLNYADFPGDMTLSYSVLGMGVLDGRAQNLDQLDAIERTSVDFYATTRSLYRQHRNAQINGGAAASKENLPNF